MTILLDHVVPWGRLFDEYAAMFSLTDADLRKHILGCGDGPASFNAEAIRKGIRVTSCDPIYAFAPAEIARRVEETYPMMIDQVKRNHDTFVWNIISSPDHLGELRMKAMHGFLEDFPEGKKEGRYQVAELPALPYADRVFELALCSHFLFLYSEQFSLEFHLQSVKELCRVAGEVRIFPLLAMNGLPSPHLNPVIDHLRQAGYTPELLRVPYEFQKGGHTMLRVTSPADY